MALAPLLKYDSPALGVLLKSQSPKTLDDSTSVTSRKNIFTQVLLLLCCFLILVLYIVNAITAFVTPQYLFYRII